MAGMLLKGDVQIARLSSSLAFEGYNDVVNGTELTITPQSQEIERLSNMRESWGQTLDSAYKPQPTQIQLGVNDVPPYILGMTFLGDVTAINQTGDAVTDEVHTVSAATQDKWIQLDNQNIVAAGFAVTNTAGDTTYVAGTDYEVNVRLGLLKVLSTGSIAVGDIHVDYTKAVITGTRVQGGLQPTIYARILMDGYNIYTGEHGLLTVWRASLTPTSPINFFAAEPITAVFQGKIIVPPNKAEGFTFEVYDAA